MKKSKSINKLKKEYWTVLSRYVRESSAIDGMVQCYTCGQVDLFTNMDLGHYWGRNYGATYFDVKNNLRIQCKHCNRFMEGNKPSFANRLLVELGADGLEKLEIKAKMKYHFDRFALEEGAKEYKRKLKKLREAR